MSVLATQPSSFLQTEWLSQAMQGNSVPLGCTNVNYPSALSGMPPSTSIQKLWRESATNPEGGVTPVNT